MCMNHVVVPDSPAGSHAGETFFGIGNIDNANPIILVYLTEVPTSPKSFCGFSLMDE